VKGPGLNPLTLTAFKVCFYNATCLYRYDAVRADERIFTKLQTLDLMGCPGITYDALEAALSTSGIGRKPEAGRFDRILADCGVLGYTGGSSFLPKLDKYVRRDGGARRFPCSKPPSDLWRACTAKPSSTRDFSA
jgi:hypothetical protein